MAPPCAPLPRSVLLADVATMMDLHLLFSECLRMVLAVGTPCCVLHARGQSGIRLGEKNTTCPTTQAYRPSSSCPLPAL